MHQIISMQLTVLCWEMHPEWKYIFWTDKSARDFIATEYSWFLEIFDSYEYPIQRADAIRYFALYHYGGVYADMDLQPKQNLEKLFSGVDVAVFDTPNMGLTNMIMGAAKGSPFLKCALAQLPGRQHQWHHTLVQLKGWKILSSTGPAYWWTMAMPTMCGASFRGGPLNPSPEKLRIVGSEVMGRCSVCKGAISTCAKNGVLKHLVGSSWHTGDISFTHFAFICQPGVAICIIILSIKLGIIAHAMITQTGTEYIRPEMIRIGLMVTICSIFRLLQ